MVEITRVQWSGNLAGAWLGVFMAWLSGPDSKPKSPQARLISSNGSKRLKLGARLDRAHSMFRSAPSRYRVKASLHVSLLVSLGPVQGVRFAIAEARTKKLYDLIKQEGCGHEHDDADRHPFPLRCMGCFEQTEKNIDKSKGGSSGTLQEANIPFPIHLQYSGYPYLILLSPLSTLLRSLT